jgi:hypothetical protein
MGALFNTKMMSIVIAGGNVHDLHHDGHSKHAFVAFEFAYPINRTQVPFEGMIPDFVCSLTTRFIWQALTKLLVEHCLKMVSQIKFLNQQVIRAFNIALVFPLVPNYFANQVQRHHIMDSFLCFWYSIQCWVFLGSYPLWHVIDSVFISDLPREASLMLQFKGIQLLLREIQAFLALPREMSPQEFRHTPLAFPTEQTYMDLLYSLRMLTQNK